VIKLVIAHSLRDGPIGVLDELFEDRALRGAGATSQSAQGQSGRGGDPGWQASFAIVASEGAFGAIGLLSFCGSCRHDLGVVTV